jgi:hypothetical protein
MSPVGLDNLRGRNMKNKLLLGIIIMLLCFVLIGCGWNDIGKKSDESVDTIEFGGVKLKNINSIKSDKLVLDENYIYKDPIVENEEEYIKLSDSFIASEYEERESEFLDITPKGLSVELFPKLIYTTDVDSIYAYAYNGNYYYIPTIKCKAGQEKIAYSDYGIEIIKENDSIKINDKIETNVIDGWDLRETAHISDDDPILSNGNTTLRYDDVSLYEAYTESWKLNSERSFDLDIQSSGESSSEYTRIYLLDLDNDLDTVELAYTNMVMEGVHIDTKRPVYSLITCGEKGIFKSQNDMLWFSNIKNYKNVFYAYDYFEIYNRVGKINSIEENVILGYYIYDKNKGLIYVDRFANGLKTDANGFAELSKIELTLDNDYVIQKDNNIYGFGMYNHAPYLLDENGEIVTDEDGVYILESNFESLSKGTKIHITDVFNEGYSITFITSDGTVYYLSNSYV